MEDSSVRKWGGTASILLGISYVLVGGAILLDPLRSATTVKEYWTTYVDRSTFRVTAQALLSLGAICGLAVVPGISSLVRKGNKGPVGWACAVCYLGFAVTAISNLQEISIETAYAERYAAGNELARSVIAASPVLKLDLYGFYRYGALGTWLLVMNLIARREGAWPKPLAYLGLVGSVLYWLIPIGNLLDFTKVTVSFVALVGGLVVGPVWFIWMGRFVRGAAVKVEGP
jgi:hypothetical protein